MSKSRRFPYVVLVLAVLVSAVVVRTQTFAPPSIATEQSAYNPGNRVLVTGQHWPAGERVTLQIAEDGNPGHVDMLHATANNDGDLSTEYIVPGHGSAQNFTITAMATSVPAPLTTGFVHAGDAVGFAWDSTSWTTAVPSTAPWVRTDRDDYQPGQVALIAGGGWAPGDLVTLTLATAEPTLVHPHVLLHAVADAGGSIYAGYVLQSHDLGESYVLRATSTADPLVMAHTSFTDDLVAQTLPFSQDWTNTTLITANDNWSAVPGITGFLGQDITTATGTDPQTLVTDSASGTDIDVIANQSNTAITNGGVAEFDGIANPVVALQGSGTADAPYVLFSIATTGLANVNVAYNLRDVDGSADNAAQPVALHYRVGTSGAWTNVPAAFVADATAGPSLATLVTAVSVPLPAAVNNQSTVQLRVITTNAVGNDEWVGVDDISITASAADQPPAVQSTTPASSAFGVAVAANIDVTFSEAVNVTGSWFSISCTTSGTHTAVVSGGPSTFTLNPDTDFSPGETCTVTVVAANVTDQDADDPPDAMATDVAVSFATASAGPAPGSVVIGEIYGGGGNSGAMFTHDFIELFNRTAAPIDLGGWSVQYASATGTSWAVTTLAGSIPAGGTYLIRQAQGAGGTTPIPTPDAVGSIAMSATAGKVALVFGTAALTGSCPTGPTIIDFAGFGTTANCFEGSGPTPAPSNTTSVSRNGGGATDTNNNASDFTAGVPTPRPSVDPAPAVSLTAPANGATGIGLDADIVITFSESVNVTGSWFAINCATTGSHAATVSGGPLALTLNPTTNFAANELCTVTVLAANVTDQDAFDPPDTMAANHVFSFQAADVILCGDPSTRIHAIQGSGLASPMLGAGVTIEGIVVGDYQAAGQLGGYYLQEESVDTDANPATSEGIFVFSNGFGADVNPGDVVRVRGTVIEFFDLTEINAVSGVVVCSTGASVTSTAVSLPVANLTELESVEGMLVQFSQTLTVTEVFNLGRFGEVSLSGAGRLFTGTAVAAPGAPAIAVTAQNNRSRIVLDDGNDSQNIDPTLYPQGGLSASNTLRVGDTLPSLTGVMDFRFSTYRIQPVGPISFNHDNPRTLAPDPVGGNLKVASFNVLNFFNGNGLGGGFPTARGATTPAELQRQKAKEVSALSTINADIVGLMEIENDTAPNSAVEELVAALNAAMGAGTYAFIDTGVIGTDEIKVALIYKPAVVTPVGSYEVLTSAVDPRFIDTLNRPSLAQTFESTANGGTLTVVVNHLKSKGSDCNAVGDRDTGDGSGNCNVTRTTAAMALVDWLATDPTGSNDPDFLMIGDFNAYTFETPIQWVTTNYFTNLVQQFVGPSGYSYVFNGESGYLDHALASFSLAAQVTGTTEWHINPDEPTVLDYNVEFKTANQINTFYDAGPYRSSDHDPVIVGINLANHPPTADAGGPYSVNEGASPTLSATGADPDGGAVSFAWDLNGDNVFETPGQSVSFAGLDGPATMTVQVKVTDENGLSTVDSATITVNNLAPTITGLVPGAASQCGQSSKVTINFSDPAGSGDTYKAVVAWGDGTSTTHTGISSGFVASHHYGASGVRTATVTVSDEDGGTSAPATASLTKNYFILSGGLLPPVDRDGSSVFKSNRTIPLTIWVIGCNGNLPGHLAVKVVVTQLTGNSPGLVIDPPASTSGADTPGFMRALGFGIYHYNLSAKALPDPSAVYKVTLTIVQTGQTIKETFRLRP